MRTGPVARPGLAGCPTMASSGAGPVVRTASTAPRSSLASSRGGRPMVKGASRRRCRSQVARRRPTTSRKGARMSSSARVRKNTSSARSITPAAWSHLGPSYALVEMLDLVSLAAALRGEGEERLVDLVGGQASIGGGVVVGARRRSPTRPWDGRGTASTATRRSSDGSQAQIGTSTTQDTMPCPMAPRERGST
jgi:hypothetical protein